MGRGCGRGDKDLGQEVAMTQLRSLSARILLLVQQSSLRNAAPNFFHVVLEAGWRLCLIDTALRQHGSTSCQTTGTFYTPRLASLNDQPLA
jgi:hypothetical protein